MNQQPTSPQTCSPQTVSLSSARRRPGTKLSLREKHQIDLRRGLAELRPELYARALRLCRCPSQAEDIVQDSIVRALRFEEQFQPGTNLRAWVGQILLSVFLTQCRRKKRERRALEHLVDDPCAWVKRDQPALMTSLSPKPARALASLSHGYRQVLQLVDLDGLSYREAATRLDVPVGTIMSRLHRGRRLLAGVLRQARRPLALPTAVAA